MFINVEQLIERVHVFKFKVPIQRLLFTIILIYLLGTSASDNETMGFTNHNLDLPVCRHNRHSSE